MFYVPDIELLAMIQAYLLLSCCPCEGRISGIVDAPNAVATLAIPTAIFDQVLTSFCILEGYLTKVLVKIKKEKR